jgi:hypothetical protein
MPNNLRPVKRRPPATDPLDLMSVSRALWNSPVRTTDHRIPDAPVKKRAKIVSVIPIPPLQFIEYEGALAITAGYTDAGFLKVVTRPTLANGYGSLVYVDDISLVRG